MYKEKYITAIKDLNIETDYVVVKPNWVEDIEGAYTEAEILDWLFEALPNMKKIVIESYTKWRGGEEDIASDIIGGKKYWDYYKQKDQKFLSEKGIDKVLAKHKIEYLNITNEVWSDRCVDPDEVEKIVKTKFDGLYWPELYSYVPKRLFEIKDNATLISLAKIKRQLQHSYILASLSIKNLFGLIPQPNRKNPYHGKGTTLLPQSIAEVHKIYPSLFKDSIFIAEGLNIWGDDCWSDDPKVVRDAGLLFTGRDAYDVDSDACKAIGIDPKTVPYLSEFKSLMKSK